MTTLATQASIHYEIVSQLPADSVVTFYGATWEDYEELLEQVGEASGLRISYNDGELEVMSLSSGHEKYADFLKQMVGAIRLRFRINILFFGSTTMKKSKEQKGKEPDACFYVQTAAALGNRIHLDFEVDPPPDIAVEIDLHHDSRRKFPIYAALGVPEIWRYDGKQVTIHYLEPEGYVTHETRLALPMLNGAVL